MAYKNSLNKCISWSNQNKEKISLIISIFQLCPFTCGNCAAYKSCSDTGVLNCTALVAGGLCKSKSPSILTMVTQNCPSSCGLCTNGLSGSNSNLCKDINAAFCVAEAVKICLCSQYFIECKTETKLSKSYILNGKTVQASCNKIQLYQFMTETCPSTCNRCPSSGAASGSTSASCVDTSPASVFHSSLYGRCTS